MAQSDAATDNVTTTASVISKRSSDPISTSIPSCKLPEPLLNELRI